MSYLISHTQVYEILSELSGAEQRRLNRFLQSPYHNTRKDVRVLFHHLKGARREKEMSREAVFAKVYPGKPFLDAKLRHVLSYLKKLLEQFLAFESFRTDEGRQAAYLLEFYQERKLENLYDTTFRSIEKKRDKSTLRDEAYHALTCELLLTHYRAAGSRNEGIAPTLELLSNAIDIRFVVSKLQQAARVMSHRRVFRTDISVRMMPEVVRAIEEYGLERIPAVAVHYSAYKMMKGDNPEAFFRKLKVQIKEYHQLFLQDDILSLYLIAINFCISRINLGKSEYVREVFELYREALENGALVRQDQLSPYTYKNIVASGLKLKEFQWTEQFIHDYQLNLPPEFQEDFFAYTLARLRFTQGAFMEASQLLVWFQSKDLFTNLDARVILLKAYYELGEFNLIENQLHNFRQLLRTKGVLTYHKTNYSNFISFLTRLINLRPFDKKARQKFISEVENAEILTEREWLLGKL